MKALILDGSRNHEEKLAEIREVIVSELAGMGWEAKPLVLQDIEIHHCLGCFGCWIKSPGVCVIKDAGREVAREVSQSDMLIFFTPITFGGYSSELKKAMDRMVCSLILPFFIRIDGETHHPPRYRKRPRLVVVGVLPQEDRESEGVFTTLVERNAINLHSPAYTCAVLYTSQGPEEIRREVRGLLQAVEVK